MTDCIYLKHMITVNEKYETEIDRRIGVVQCTLEQQFHVSAYSDLRLFFDHSQTLTSTFFKQLMVSWSW